MCVARHQVWDLRKEEVVMSLKGHSDTVTGMRLSPDGTHLLSNSMDNTLRIWDMRPYAPEQRCTKVLTGHQHTFEKNLLKCDWSPNGKKVCRPFIPLISIAPVTNITSSPSAPPSFSAIGPILFVRGKNRSVLKFEFTK
jgi:hypothetical protein